MNLPSALQALLRNVLNSGFNAEDTPLPLLRRIRLINISLLCLFAIGLLYGVRFARIGAYQTAAGVGVAIALCLVAMLVLRAGGSVVLAGHLGAAAVLLAAIISVGAGGGYEHRTLGWLYVVPLAAGLLAGVRAGIIWGAGAYIAAVVFWWLHFNGAAVPNLIPETELQRQAFFEVLGVFLAIGVLTITFVRQQRRSQTKMIEALNALETEVDRRKRAEIKARAASEEKSRFLATMSHELRTPLNSVIGFSGLLLQGDAARDDPEDGQSRLYLERIRDNGEHLLALINDILDISKIEAGRTEVHLEPVKLDRLVEDAVASSASLAQAKGLELEVEVPADLDPVIADERRLKQILINLVANAIRFTESGRVAVRVSSRPSSRQPARLDVIDTGVGIPAEQMDKIFEPFRQVDDSHSRAHQGTGLGLAIARSLCDLMGFELSAKSVVDRGSTFTIAFANPAADDDAGALEARLGSRSTRPRVLVIDDDPDSRLLLHRCVADAGYEAMTASSGDQGLEIARRERPDLITLDLMMPGMSGWSVLERVKQDPALKDIPVVVVSIVAGENRGTILGAIDKLSKPIDPEDLAKILARELEERR